MAKYLDDNGLLYFWQQLKNIIGGKVDKVDGKGLSTNDYTTAEQTKLAGIDTGAEVNVIESITVNGTAATITSKTAAITTPTKTSDLTNDSNFITIADVPEGAAASTTTPKMDGTASTGSETAFARGDHIHPTDTSRQAKITASGILKGNGSGTVTAATAGTDYQAPLPAQTNNSGKYLTTNGTTMSWATVDALPSQSGKNGKYLKTNGSAASWEDAPDISGKADLASPTFTGTPAAPTATAGTNTTQIATTAFVTTAISNAQTGAAMFQGNLAAQSTLTNASYKKGWYWVVSTAGTYAGEVCEVGDMVYAIADKSSSYSASDFVAIQRNLDIASITNAEIDTVLAS